MSGDHRAVAFGPFAEAMPPALLGGPAGDEVEAELGELGRVRLRVA